MLRLAFASFAGRRSFVGASLVALLLTSSQLASAQTQPEIAAELNEQGKKLMLDRKPAEASKLFADAAARDPNPKYFYNLCKAYYFQGMLFEAMDACGNARKENAPATLVEKIDDLEGAIKEEAKKQGVDLSKPPTTPTPPGPDQPDPTTDPTQPQPPQPQPQPPTTVNPRAPQGIYSVMAPRHEYVWTVGADLFFGSANIDDEDAYGNGAAGIRLRVDYMLAPVLGLGAQGYLDYINVTAGDEDVSIGQNLSIVNFGAALYKHFCFGKMCVTPLAGLQFAALDTETSVSTETSSAAFGLRVEGGLSYAFGSNFQHVVSANLGHLRYGEPEDTDTLMFDRGGGVTYLAIGYTRRFSTPFGSAPILGLE